MLELRKTSQWCQFENTASKMINVSLWLLTLTPDWARWERHEFCTFLCSATYSISDIVGGILDCIYISKSLPHLHIILDDDTTFVRNANIKKCIYLQAADRRTIVAWRISWARSEYFFRGEYSSGVVIFWDHLAWRISGSKGWIFSNTIFILKWIKKEGLKYHQTKSFLFPSFFPWPPTRASTHKNCSCQQFFCWIIGASLPACQNGSSFEFKSWYHDKLFSILFCGINV